MARYTLLQDVELILWCCLYVAQSLIRLQLTLTPLKIGLVLYVGISAIISQSDPSSDGYHISELNFPEASITCGSTASDLLAGSVFPPCLEIDSSRYSAATAIFTLGGLAGSLMSSKVSERVQAIGSIKVTGLLNVVGSVMMFAAPHWLVVLAGR